MGAQAHISARLPSYVRATSMAVVGKPVRGSECFSPLRRFVLMEVGGNGGRTLLVCYSVDRATKKGESWPIGQPSPYRTNSSWSGWPFAP